MRLPPLLAGEGLPGGPQRPWEACPWSSGATRLTGIPADPRDQSLGGRMEKTPRQGRADSASCSWYLPWGFPGGGAAYCGGPQPRGSNSDGPRWSRYNHNRKKVHNECNALKASPKPCPAPGLWINCPPWNLSLVPKRLETASLLEGAWAFCQILVLFLSGSDFGHILWFLWASGILPVKLPE